jgi:hypothetical protein
MAFYYGLAIGVFLGAWIGMIIMVILARAARNN